MERTNVAVLRITQTVDHKGTPIEAGYKPALCFRGRKWMLAVVIDHPVRVLRKPIAEFARGVPLLRGGAPYPLERYLRQLQAVANRNGITLAARALLTRAASGQSLTEMEEEIDDTKLELTKMVERPDLSPLESDLSNLDPGTTPETAAKSPQTTPPADTSVCEEKKMTATTTSTSRTRGKRTAPPKVTTNKAPKKKAAAKEESGSTRRVRALRTLEDANFHVNSNREKLFKSIVEAGKRGLSVDDLVAKGRTSFRMTRGQVLAVLGKMVFTKHINIVKEDA